MDNRDFYIQIVDDDSFIAVDEFFIGSWSIQEFADRLGCDPISLAPGGFFSLEGEMKDKVETIFEIDLSRENCEANLISWSESDGIPYRTHSGRELILMKEGLKPLSVFTSMTPSSPDALALPTHLFADFVSSGRILMRTYCELLDNNPIFNGLEVVLYAAPAEAWRLDAYILVRTTARKLGWSEPLVRMEGALLGYSEWQNDAFIAAGTS